MSTVSTAAICSVLATIRSASRCSTLARGPAGPRSAHGRNATTAAVTAAWAVSASPLAMSASFHDQSSGERSSNVCGDGHPLAADEVVGRDLDTLDDRHQSSTADS